jgi:trehalose 6-phosphate synthase
MSFTATVDAIDRDIAGLRAALGARRMILGVDRLDYSKGIPERLLAFEALLERYPEWRSQVSLVQISVPSREEVPEYAELRTTVEKLVGRINGRYGEADWVPVRYLYRSYDHRVLAQLYRLADIALVTPLRDGLNLVAKEFIAAQDAEQPGVLVLSRFAGAAEQLTNAVLTNPYHADGLAADLDFALRMPQGERRRRHELLRAVIAETSPESWASMFVGRLREAWRPTA